MLRKIVRCLSRLDDLVEVAFVGSFAMLRRRWKPLALVALVACGATLVGPTVVCGLQGWFLAHRSPARALPIEVRELVCSRSGYAATIAVSGRDFAVKAGDKVDVPGHGTMLVAAIGSTTLKMYDPRSQSLITLEHRTQKSAPRRRNSSVQYKVSAIAGDAPKFVAVIEFRGETYIVQQGSRVPNDEYPSLCILDVTAAEVIAVDTWSKELVRKVVDTQPTTAGGANEDLGDI